jgi:hypothetical protein
MKVFCSLRATGLAQRILLLINSVWLLSSWVASQGVGAPGGTCSDAVPCYQGCCSREYSCGFTPEHCGTGCISNCNATAECGQYALSGHADCPINVCCRYVRAGSSNHDCTEPYADAGIVNSDTAVSPLRSAAMVVKRIRREVAAVTPCRSISSLYDIL